MDYQLTGQPVLIGGTMGTCSYVLTGTEQGMKETFGSTCHGAVSLMLSAKFMQNHQHIADFQFFAFREEHYRGQNHEEI